MANNYKKNKYEDTPETENSRGFYNGLIDEFYNILIDTEELGPRREFNELEDMINF